MGLRIDKSSFVCVLPYYFQRLAIPPRPVFYARTHISPLLQNVSYNLPYLVTLYGIKSKLNQNLFITRADIYIQHQAVLASNVDTYACTEVAQDVTRQ